MAYSYFGRLTVESFQAKAHMQRKLELGIKKEITSFFKKNDRQDLKTLASLIYNWKQYARLGLSLGHKTYLQSLCALFNMLDPEKYGEYIQSNKSVNLNNKRNLDGSFYLDAALDKLFLSCFFSRGVQYDKNVCDLLLTWQHIIIKAGELHYETDKLSNLKIKGEKFMQSSEEEQRLILGNIDSSI